MFFDVVIQMDGTPLRRVVTDFRQEGFNKLYRGLLPPLMARTAQVSLMFGLYETFSHQLRDLKFQSVNFWAALATGATEAVLLTPFETVQTILSCCKLHSHYRNTYDVVKQLSLRELWSGVGVIAARNVINAALFFPSKEYFRVKAKDLPVSTFVADFLSGAGLGAAISSALFPLHVLKLQIQREVGFRRRAHLVSLSRQLLEERGWTGLYRGVPLHFVRAFISWGIINSLYEQVKMELGPEGKT